MGTYLNPGNSGFENIRSSIYVDKTGLIGVINRTIGTKQKMTCVSRPRRFGKSFAAQMLCAYYDKTCDSSALFAGLEIASDSRLRDTYEKHLNQYDVIYLDMTNIMGETGKDGMVSYIRRKLIQELASAYPALQADEESLSTTLVRTVELTGNKFIMIVDEWDAPIRETPEIQKQYLAFMRSLFKSSGTTDRIFAAVYITGILPIKKDGSESAISDFWEYSMLEPGEFQPYVGFLEGDVKRLCAEHDLSFQEAKRWYDGYSFDTVKSVYNPYSIMKAVVLKKFRSYWRMSSAADALADYIAGDYDGLFQAVLELLGGFEIPVDTDGFNNDVKSVGNRDDMLTLLIHLGYLAYDGEEGTVRIPNEEIRLEFSKSIREVKSGEAVMRLRESRQLIQDTVQMNEAAVAAQVERIHAEMTAPLHYNNEQALRSVIQIAYYSYSDDYLKFEELPSGDGYADIVYLPKRTSRMPVLVIELKWNKSAEGAIAQIREKRYYEALKGYGGDILLVGISYDRDAGEEKRKHTCVIEKIAASESPAK